jgi:formylmethanofuran dehydrogenase subunit E
MCHDAYPADFAEAVRFHGHVCPGLAIGFRASTIAMSHLGAERAEDEELIAIVENDSCSADAVQWLTGCTFGKGNFYFRDYGKQVFTFALRPSGRAVRVALRAPEQRPPTPEGDRAAAVEQMLAGPEEELFAVELKTIVLPDTARIQKSVRCDRCGEPVMESRIRRVSGEQICIPCAEVA